MVIMVGITILLRTNPIWSVQFLLLAAAFMQVKYQYEHKCILHMTTKYSLAKYQYFCGISMFIFALNLKFSSTRNKLISDKAQIRSDSYVGS